MAIVPCKNGHYYNDSESRVCPYCSGESSIGKTIPLDGDAGSFPETSLGIPPTGAYDRTRPMTDLYRESDESGKTQMLDYKKTEPINTNKNVPVTEFVKNPEYGDTLFLDEKKNSEIKPVRGWLVVVEGEKCGIDFRIHSGHNYVGRSKSNDICFDFDQTISKEKCCVIVYDDRKNAFHIQSGEGINNIYINDDILLGARRLWDDDIIEIGQTKLVFRALCNSSFNYN